MPTQTKHLPILYSFRRCPYAMRARLAIAYSQIQCQLREVVLKDKPQALLDISPKATVPVLQLANGSIIEESLEIMQWALSNNTKDKWFSPLMSTEKQFCLDLIQKNDSSFKTWLDRYKYADRYPEFPPEYYRGKAQLFLNKLEYLLAHNGCLLRSDWTLADIAIFPFIRQFRGVNETWFDNAPYPLLIAWLDNLVNNDLFQQVMHQYPQWHPDDSVTLFP